MKIIFLNAWQGRQTSLIQNFILENKSTTDIFCFQESRIRQKSPVFCQSILSDFQLFTTDKYFTNHNKFNQSTFIKNKFEIVDSKTIGENNSKVGLGLFTQIKTPSGVLNLCNVHGRAFPGHKQDTPNRIRQSQLIIDFFKKLSGPKIIGGDFNLDFNTKSVQMFEDNGYKNLIKDFNISTTRNEIAWADYEIKQLFADYVFVSPDIKITNFSVPNNEISDHLPLILEIKI